MNSETWRIRRGLDVIVAATSALVVSCAEPGKPLEQAALPNQVRPDWQRADRAGDPVIAAVGAMTLLFELAKKPSSKLASRVSGTCRVVWPPPLQLDEDMVEPERALEACKSTYIEVENLTLKRTMTIWVDSDGHFQFAVRRGEKYRIRAVNDGLGLKSEPKDIAGPGEALLRLEARALLSGEKPSDRLSPGDPSSR